MQKEKINEIEVLFIYLLLFSLGQVVVQVTINLYFILSVNTFKKLEIKLTFDLKVNGKIYSLPFSLSLCQSQ